MYFCLIIPRASVAAIAEYVQVLYREVVVYSLFSTERKKKKQRVVGVSLERGVQQKSGSARKRMSLLSLCTGPVRQGNGNIISTEGERASLLCQLKWLWQKVRNSDTKMFSFAVYQFL